MDANIDSIVRWLSELVQIPSVNPAHAGPRAGEVGEGRVAARLAEAFGALGGEVVMDEVYPDRPNVYGIWHGQTDRWLAVDVHTDTVGVEQMTDEPFDGRVENGRVYGRGAVDTKATLAVVLGLLEQLKQENVPLPFNLLVGATVSEEVGGNGADFFAKWVRKQQIPLDNLIVAEPTMNAPVHAHKGVSGYKVIVHGEAVHSSQPDTGKNALHAAAHLIVALEAEHARLRDIPAETSLGPATLAVTIAHAGIGANIVPDRCDLIINRRNIPGEDPQAVADALEKLVQESCPLPVTWSPAIGHGAFHERKESPWLQQVAEWTGEPVTVVPYGTNALKYGTTIAKETMIFGPGTIDHAHGAVEWVEIEQLRKTAEMYLRWWGIK